ncbi:MAG TPA: hypothetical protein VHK88_11210, partial [Aquihabitans sp.]|nr:hypothetical protein [Aquihabitans sp.]
ATAPRGAPSGSWSADARTPSGRTAAEAARVAGLDPGDAAIVVPGLREVEATNRGQHEGARLGALAAALERNGWSTAVVADGGPASAAGLAVVSPDGGVDAGTLDPAPGSVGDAIAALPATRAVAVVELDAVARAEVAEAGPAERRRAVADADRDLAAVVDALGPDDLLVVLSPTAPGTRDHPTPFVVAGPGIDAGTACSATTRKAGYVTLADVSALVLDRAGIRVPGSMAGTPITTEATSASGAARLAERGDAIAETRFVDRAAGHLLVALPIVFATWSLLALVVTVLPLGRAAPAARALVRWVGLLLATVPIVTFAVAAPSVRDWGQPRWAVVVWVAAAVLGAAAALLRPPARAAIAVAALTWAVLVVDLLTGGRLQFDSALGNSPSVGWRFAGIGNLAFGLLAASTLVLAVAAWWWVGRRRPGTPAVVAAGAIFAVAVVVDGAPDLGADVGGVLTLATVGALTLWTLAGRRLSPVRIALAGLVALGVLGLLAAVDLTRPEASQTHLGRLVRDVFGGGGGDSIDVLWRKADAALATFVRSSLVWIVICTVLLGGLLWGLARPALRRLLALPAARPLVVGGGALLLLGGALNDSGVMVPAIMATVLVPAAVHLLLAPPAPEPDPTPVERAPAVEATVGRA